MTTNAAPTCTQTCVQTGTYYHDADGDGYGAGDGSIYTVGSQPSGWVTTSGDCDDSSASIYPGKTRVRYQTAGSCGGTCTSETQTCQSSGSWTGSYTYSSCSTAGTTYYRDADGDGYGSPSVTTTACSQPSGYVSNSLDCYDSNALANPNGVWQSYARGDGSWDWNCDGVETHKWCGQTYAIGNAWQNYSDADYYNLSGSTCSYGGSTDGYYSTTYTMTDICNVACGSTATGKSCSSTYMYTTASCSAGSGGQYYQPGGISQQDCK